MIKTLELDIGRLPIVGEDPASMQPGYYPPGWLNGVFYPSGLYVPLSLPSWENSPSPKVEVTAGDTLRLRVSFKYRGPAQSGVFSLYAAVMSNRETSVVDEWSGYNSGYKSIDAPYAVDWVTRTETLDIPIPTGTPLWEHGGEDGAVYFKVHKDILTEWFSPGYLNALHVVSAVGEFGELKITGIEKV